MKNLLKNRSLSTKTRIILCLLMIPTMVFSFYNYFQNKGNNIRYLENTTSQTMILLTNLIEFQFADIGLYSDMIAVNSDLADLKDALSKQTVDRYQVHLLFKKILTDMQSKIYIYPYIKNITVVYYDINYVIDFKYGINKIERYPIYDFKKNLMQYKDIKTPQMDTNDTKEHLINFYHEYRIQGTQTPIGVHINVDTEKMYQYLERNLQNTSYDFALIDNNNQHLIIGSDETRWQDILPQLEQKTTQTHPIYIDDEHIISSSNLYKYQMKLVTVSEISDIRKSFRDMLILLCLNLALVAVIYLVIGTVAVKKLYAPIKKLIARIQDKNGKSQRDEGVILQNHFDFIDNQMSQIRLKNQNLEEDIQRASPMLHDTAARLLLLGDSLTWENNGRMLNEYKIYWQFNCYMVVRMELFDEREEKIFITNEIFSVIYTALNRESILNQDCIGCVLNQSCYFIFNLENAQQADTVLKQIEAVITKLIDGDLHYFITAAHCCDTIENICNCMEQCDCSSHELYVRGMDCVAQINPSDLYMDAPPYYSQQFEDHLIASLPAHEFSESQQMLKCFLEDLAENNHYQYYAVILGIRKLALTILNYMLRNKIRLSITSQTSAEKMIQTIDSHLTMTKTQEWLEAMIGEIIAFHKDGLQAKQEMILDIMDCIQKNFAEPVSLDTMSDYFGKSRSYLSKIIKKETGLNFIDIITGVRIEAAKSLLCNTNKSVSEVARAIGYEYDHYFIKKFRESENITPGQYREQHKAS